MNALIAYLIWDVFAIVAFIVAGIIAEYNFGIGVGIMAIGGVLLLFGKAKETQRALGTVGTVFGAFTILFPTYIIGTCNPGCLCCDATKPAWILLGALTILVSAIMIAKPEP